jgi:hypothetical protein
MNGATHFGLEPYFNISLELLPRKLKITNLSMSHSLDLVVNGACQLKILIYFSVQ